MPGLSHPVGLLSHSFGQCLEDSLQRLRSGRLQSSLEPLLMAAACSLRLGQVAKALKLAARALLVKPQDVTARSLVKECTKELEYEGRTQAIQALPPSSPSPPGAAVSRLLETLQSDDESCGDDARVLLEQLAKELDTGGVDAQIIFHQHKGWATVMPYLNSAYQSVAEVLLAAGSCHLYRPPADSGRASLPSGGSKVAAALMGPTGSVRVRWPALVLEQLLSAALGEGQQGGTHPDVASGALQLLAFAALDPHQRQSGLASGLASRSCRLDQAEDGACSSAASSLGLGSLGELALGEARVTAPNCSSSSSSDGAPSEGVMCSLLDAAMTPWLDSLPAASLVTLVQLLASYATGMQVDRQLLARAARGRPLQVLLHIYGAAKHLGGAAAAACKDCEDGSSGGSDEVPKPPCCEACHLALSSMLCLCSCEPSLLRAEAFTRLSDASRKATLAAKPLLRELVRAAAAAVKHSQPCTLPDLCWDGTIKAYVQGRAAADPCSGRQGGGTGVSLLEKWVRLLAAAASGSRAAVLEMYRCQVTELLEDITAGACRGSPPSLLAAVEEAYGHLARQSQAVAQDICDSPLATALTGMALHSKQPSLVLVALDRLTPRVDALSGADFLQVVRPGGVLAAAHQLLLLSLKAGAAADAADSPGEGQAAAGDTAAAGVHPWEAAVAAAAAAMPADPKGGAMSPGSLFAAQLAACPQRLLSFALPQTGAMRDAARCLLLACLDRARRMAGLKPMQVPRIGYWQFIRPRELQLMERRLREDWASAMLPQLPARSDSRSSADAWDGRPTSAGPVTPCSKHNSSQDTRGGDAEIQQSHLPRGNAAEAAPASVVAVVDGMAPAAQGAAPAQPAPCATPDGCPEQDAPVRLPEPFATSPHCCGAAGGAQPHGASRRALRSHGSECLDDTANMQDSAQLLRTRLHATRSGPCSLLGAAPLDASCCSREQQPAAAAAGEGAGGAAATHTCQALEEACLELRESASTEQQQQQQQQQSENRPARSSWRSLALHAKVSWSQTSDEINVWVKLPKGTSKLEVEVQMQPQHLCVKLGWHGRFLDGPLKQRVKSGESVWCLTGSDESGQYDLLHVMMPKSEPHYWRSLFEGSEERSHMELLKEAVEADEAVISYDDMDEGAKEIFEDLRERQALVTRGMIDLENSFDDFRVVVGDATL